MKYIFLLIIIISFCNAYGQVAPRFIDINRIHYEPLTENNYKDFPNAKLILDYYYTNGVSTGDRYSYEIILIDSLLMFGFSSPETEDYHYISYEKKQLLTERQLKNIKAVLLSANLKQIKNGIPDPDASAHTKEVLVVKYKTINIAGGLFNHVLFENDTPKAEVLKEVARERKSTSSIGGNYDEVFNAMRKLFVELSTLLKQVDKGFPANNNLPK